MTDKEKVPKKPIISKGMILKVINTEPLPGNTIKPPLVSDKECEAKDIHICQCGVTHVDVGLASMYNSISCYHCGDSLPQGDERHWCHPSRFEIQSISYE